MSNEALYGAALEAANRLFGDTSVSRSTTKAQLKALVEEIETMLDTLEDPDD